MLRFSLSGSLGIVPFFFLLIAVYVEIHGSSCSLVGGNELPERNIGLFFLMHCLMTIFFEQATFQRPSPDTLRVSITGALRTKVDSNGADVLVALYENGLMTDCPKGENKGRVLSNDFVVRRLEKLCTVKDISAKKTVTGTVNLTLWDSFNSCKCGIAVFVQNKSYHIFGSQNFELPDNL